MIIKDIAPEYESVQLRVLNVRQGKAVSADLLLPKLEGGQKPVNSRVGFEGSTFPPSGWEKNLLQGNVCRADETAALTGVRGLLCQDLQSLQSTLVRSGLRFTLPSRRMSWRLGADIKPVELELIEGQEFYPLASWLAMMY